MNPDLDTHFPNTFCTDSFFEAKFVLLKESLDLQRPNSRTHILHETVTPNLFISELAGVSADRIARYEYTDL